MLSLAFMGEFVFRHFRISISEIFIFEVRAFIEKLYKIKIFLCNTNQNYVSRMYCLTFMRGAFKVLCNLERRETISEDSLSLSLSALFAQSKSTLNTWISES